MGLFCIPLIGYTSSRYPSFLQYSLLTYALPFKVLY
nr:MAG TPA: hypothetical protein [Caudoviricetes sp.]